MKLRNLVKVISLMRFLQRSGEKLLLHQVVGAKLLLIHHHFPSVACDRCRRWFDMFQQGGM